MVIIAVVNQKGGVAKTTTTHNIGAALSILRGRRVLFVDLDGQGNLTYCTGCPGNGGGIMSVLEDPTRIRDGIVNCGPWDVLPASAACSRADDLLRTKGREYRLRQALDSVAGQYDFALLDTPPALGIMTVNALTAADGAIIPTGADVLSLQGVAQLSGTIAAVKRYSNPKLELLGIALTRYEGRTILARTIAESAEQAAEQLHTVLYHTRVRECTAIKEAQLQRKDIFSYSRKSNGAADYAALTDEILNQIGEHDHE